MARRLQISPHDPRWVPEFEAERDRIACALGELAHRIDHSGSTALPGVEAKPVIDIQVSVEQLQPRSSRWVASNCPMRTMPCARAFIDRVNGRTRTMSILCSSAATKSDAHWHFVTFCESTPTLRANTSLSRNV